jgi:hypothetical protein
MDEIKTSEEPTQRKRPSACSFFEKWAEAWKQLEEKVRQGPRQHLLMALIIGYLLQIIPFRSLLGVALKLCLRLARPVLFLVCTFQLAKYLRKGPNSGGASD